MNTIKVTDTVLVLYAEQKLDTAIEQRLLQRAERDAGLADILAALRLSRLPYQLACTIETLPPQPGALKKLLSELLNLFATQYRSSQQL